MKSRINDKGIHVNDWEYGKVSEAEVVTLKASITYEKQSDMISIYLDEWVNKLRCILWIVWFVKIESETDKTLIRFANYEKMLEVFNLIKRS
jgi:hypothetical protein